MDEFKMKMNWSVYQYSFHPYTSWLQILFAFNFSHSPLLIYVS
jgi:hypothetical protein